jgi:hypothetical protein
MWAQLTYDGVGQTYDLPVKRVIASAQAVTDGQGVQHPSTIFSRWSPAELLAIGWPPFREERFDQAHLKSTGVSDTITGSEMLRSHTTAPRPVADLQALRRADILSQRDAVMHGGIVFAGRAWPSGAVTVDAVTLIATALTDGETLPAGFTWRDLTGAEVEVSEAQFKAFRNSLAAHFVKAAKNAADHAAAVDALADAQAVIDYDFSTGWPANPAPPE